MGLPRLLPGPCGRPAQDPETYFKMFLCELVNASETHDWVVVAAYVLWKCNRLQRYLYLKPFGVPAPTNDVREILALISPSKEPDHLQWAGKQFVDTMIAQVPCPA